MIQEVDAGARRRFRKALKALPDPKKAVVGPHETWVLNIHPDHERLTLWQEYKRALAVGAGVLTAFWITLAVIRAFFWI